MKYKIRDNKFRFVIDILLVITGILSGYMQATGVSASESMGWEGIWAIIIIFWGTPIALGVALLIFLVNTITNKIRKQKCYTMYKLCLIAQAYTVSFVMCNTFIKLILDSRSIFYIENMYEIIVYTLTSIFGIVSLILLSYYKRRDD